MGNIYLHQEDRTISTLLSRIGGRPVVGARRDLDPMYEQPVPEPNRGKLLDFYASMLTEELSLGRVCVVLGNMYRVSIWLDHRPFDQLSRSDVAVLIEKIRNMRIKRNAKRTVLEAYAEQTVESYKIAIKKFWRWLKNPGLMPAELRQAPYPPEVNWIKRRKGKNNLLPKDVWTPEEVNKMAGVAANTRDRAFILGLFGSGCRIGEFLPLRRRDVIFDNYSCQVLVEGKTGSRRIRLTPTASLSLAAWLEVHPNKDPQAPVWVNILSNDGIPSRQLSYDWANEMLRRLARRAGVSKPIRPHLMRHSLATYYAPKLTEAVMNEHFGWHQGGRTASIYTHLSGKQVDDQILAVFGKKRKDEERDQAIAVAGCPRCGLENLADAFSCSKCGFTLSDGAARELIERRSEADSILDFVTKHPDVVQAIRKALAECHA